MKTKYRLRRSADFKAVREERRGAGDGLLRIQFRANGMGHPRLGIVVSRRLGGAVQRNRLRRRLRAAAAQQLGTLGACDVVLLPQPAAVALGGAALTESLERVLVSLGEVVR